MVVKSIFAILGALCLLAGCTTIPFRYVIVDTRNPSGGPYTDVAKLSDTRQDVRWQIDGKVEQAGMFRVKYHPLYTTKRCVVVEGSIVSGEKKKYPVILDTGASQALFVKGIHVLENKLLILRPGSGQVYCGVMFRILRASEI